MPNGGLQAKRFRRGGKLAVTRLPRRDHPRTCGLPNGDVLVALTNRPPSDEPGGITGAIQKFLFRKAGADDPTPNTIALLRDVDGDGRAEQRALLKNAALSSPAGMAWANGTLYVANHDAVLAFPYDLGAISLARSLKLMDPPGPEP